MSKPRIMIFDIETSGNIVYTFQIGRKVSIFPEQILKEGKIICICWKILGERKVYSLQWDDKQNDREMLKTFAKEIDSVDAVVAHNGDSFDVKHLKARLLYHRLQPLTNLVTIDTLKLSRANFKFNSHKLGYATKYLGFEGKLDTGGLKLWLQCEEGNKSALNKMVKYCKKDVLELENFFKTILPYCDRIPTSMSAIINGNREGCPMCGSLKLQKDGFKVLRAGRYQALRCTKCGHKFRDHKLIKN